MAKKRKRYTKRKNGEFDPTPLQKNLAVELLSNKHKTKKAAVEAAGYSEQSAHNPAILIETKGVQKYLTALEKEAKKKGKKPLRKQVMNVFYDGLSAEKISGGERIPDHKERRSFAEAFCRWFGWTMPENYPEPSKVMNQYNFFSTPQKDQNEFNSNLKAFLKSRQNGQ